MARMTRDTLTPRGLGAASTQRPRETQPCPCRRREDSDEFALMPESKIPKEKDLGPEQDRLVGWLPSAGTGDKEKRSGVMKIGGLNVSRSRRRIAYALPAGTRRFTLAASILLGTVAFTACQQEASPPKTTPPPTEPPAAPEPATQPTAPAQGDRFNVLASDIRWLPAPRASGLPQQGVEMAILQGHPVTMGPFTFRLRFQPGARLMPHTHPSDENITVISGTLHQGVGETFDQTKTEAIPAGGFVHRSPGVPHFVWFSEETVLQFHGIGPFGITYVDGANSSGR